ncbi:hypothetical protein [Lysobacter sp. F6437]|uniref:hypothetical protein n=1 Tax=Lysobacter sp. F6437 TaxID=3459296 RepID=UPI00403DBC67
MTTDNKALADWLSVDALAQAIREVDGRHDLGAGALAEALLPRIAALSPQADKARGEWQPIETAPIDTPILLWNNETGEIVIGHKPPDGPHDECVVVGMTAAYADAWHPLPGEPESEDEDTTPQPNGDGFTAADMMDARAEERARLSGSQVSGGGELLAIQKAIEKVDLIEQYRIDSSNAYHRPLMEIRAALVAALSTPQARPDGGEAVAWQYEQHGNWFLVASDEPWRSKGMSVRPLYTHPAPAPDVARRAVEAIDNLANFACNLATYSADAVSIRNQAEALATPFTAAQQEAE